MTGRSDVHDVLSLTNLSEIEKVFARLEQDERNVAGELQALLDQRSHVDTQMSSLQRIIPNLSVLVDDAQRLADSVANTCRLADGVSGKVRQLDLAKSRVQEAIQRADDIMDLKNCVDGVQSALEEEKYEQAAGHVHRYLTLDKSILDEATSDTSGGAASATKLLSEAEHKLKEIVHQKFDSAVENGHVDGVERFFKIFPLLNLHDQGLQKFGKYLRLQIARTSAENLALARHETGQREGVIYADTLTLLFEAIARLAERHQPLVETHYGPTYVLPLLRIFQAECDVQAKKIFQQFEQERQIDRKIQEIRLALHPTKQAGERLDPRDLDILLGEVTLLSSRTELYFVFLRRRVEEGVPSSEVVSAVDAIEQLVTECELCRQRQEIIQHYTSMEDFFMRESISKAVHLDKSSPGQLTSSMVDDIFFVLRKSVRRAVSSACVSGVCAVLSHCCSLLSTDFMEIFDGKLKAGYTSGRIDFSGVLQGKLTSTVQTMQSSLASSADTAAAKQAFLLTLNNIEVTIQNVKKLAQDLDAECKRHLDLEREGALAKVQTCLEELNHCVHGFHRQLENGQGQLCRALYPKMRPLVDAFSSFPHELTEEEFTTFETHDQFVEQLITGLDSLFLPFKTSLTGENYTQLVNVLTTELTVQLEKIIMKTSFNQLGGLQFDKELRALVSYLSTVSQWTIRDKFSRLMQFATILNLERPAEIHDYWGANAGPVTWRLTPNEVRAIMALRSDFRREDVDRLKL